MLQITADIFSGRPNPTLVVEAGEAETLLRQIADNRSAIAAVDEGYQGLGYRGLIVESMIDNIASRYELPYNFRVAHNANPQGAGIADRIFSLLRRANVLDERLFDLVNRQFTQIGSRATVGEEATEADGSEPPPASPAPGAAPSGRPAAKAVTCMIEVGSFNPGFWNDPAHIGKNNCYNYASNRRTDTFAQPGRASGHQATTMACANVTAAALSDGLHHRFDCFPDTEKPRWLMALVVAPGYDYHWYRKQKEGFWGHKPGHTPAKNVDNNGAVVWNPETAARSPYTDFCGYFYACKSQRIS